MILLIFFETFKGFAYNSLGKMTKALLTSMEV